MLEDYLRTDETHDEARDTSMTHRHARHACVMRGMTHLYAISKLEAASLRTARPPEAATDGHVGNTAHMPTMQRQTTPCVQCQYR